MSCASKIEHEEHPSFQQDLIVSMAATPALYISYIMNDEYFPRA